VLLWVLIVLPYLENAYSDEDFKDILLEAPDSLSGLYQKA
jgi:hypothetical protein